jgi:hypothetical protein
MPSRPRVAVDKTASPGAPTERSPADEVLARDDFHQRGSISRGRLLRLAKRASEEAFPRRSVIVRSGRPTVGLRDARNQAGSSSAGGANAERRRECRGAWKAAWRAHCCPSADGERCRSPTPAAGQRRPRSPATPTGGSDRWTPSSGPGASTPRRVAYLAIATISGAVRDDPNRADGMVALPKEIYGREPGPHEVVLREQACRRRPAGRRVTAPACRSLTGCSWSWPTLAWPWPWCWCCGTRS